MTFEIAGRRLQDAIPQQGEEAFLAAAVAIGALAAHSGSARGFTYAAGLGERVEEAELAIGRPAIAADLGISTLAHRPAWITKALL